MPILYRPDYAAHIAYIKGEGSVTFEDCVELIRQQQKDVSFRLHEINDYRGITLEVDARNVEELAGMNRELYANIKNIRFAVVVDSGLGYGMSRMFDVYLDESVTFKIFEDYDEALAWVKEAADQEPLV